LAVRTNTELLTILHGILRTFSEGYGHDSLSSTLDNAANHSASAEAILVILQRILKKGNSGTAFTLMGQLDMLYKPLLRQEQLFWKIM
jgi:hypothetical protein